MIPKFTCRDENSQYTFEGEFVTIKYKNYHTTEWDVTRFMIKMITTPKYMESAGIILEAMKKENIEWSTVRNTMDIVMNQTTEYVVPMFRGYWKMPRKTNLERLRISKDVMKELLEYEGPLDRKAMEEDLHTDISAFMQKALMESESFEEFCENLKEAGKEMTNHARKYEKERYTDKLQQIRERA